MEALGERLRTLNTDKTRRGKTKQMRGPGVSWVLASQAGDMNIHDITSLKFLGAVIFHNKVFRKCLRIQFIFCLNVLITCTIH